MMKLFKCLILTIFIMVVFINPVTSQELIKLNLENKIAFLRNYSIWLAELDGSLEHKITSDSLRVDDFLFSQGRKYLAYSIIVGSEEQPGVWDSTETPPQRDICSIIIFDLHKNKIIKQTDSNWVYIVRWLPGEKLLYYVSSGFDIGPYYIYDPNNNSLIEVESDGNRNTESDFSHDETIEAYIDNYGKAIRLYDRIKKTDTLIVQKDGTICDVRISNDKKTIAYVEVQYINQKSFDVLWLFDCKNNSSIKLFKCPAHAKFANINYLDWSFDDRYIGMLYPPEAIIIDVHNPSKIITTAGNSFSWISNNELIFNHDGNVYQFNVLEQTTKLLIRDAEKPVVIR